MKRIIFVPINDRQYSAGFLGYYSAPNSPNSPVGCELCVNQRQLMKSGRGGRTGFPQVDPCFFTGP
jgi:hypothetical protein